MSTRDQLKAVIVEALRSNTDSALAPWDVAVTAAEATGLRRAAWHALTPRQKARLVREARQVTIDERAKEVVK